MAVFVTVCVVFLSYASNVSDAEVPRGQTRCDESWKWDQESDEVLKSALKSHFFCNVCFLLSAGEKETAPAEEEAESQPAWSIHHPASFKPLSTKLNNRYFKKYVNKSINLQFSMFFVRSMVIFFHFLHLLSWMHTLCASDSAVPLVAPNRAASFLWNEEGKQCRNDTD